MNIYQACVILGIWNTVKAHAEIWNIIEYYDDELLNNLRIIIKKNFLNLCMYYHPDKGGKHEDYLRIKQAFDLVKDATHEDFIDSLDKEKEFNIRYFDPGSKECINCKKWSDIVNNCITITCSGFDKFVENNKFANINKFSVITEIDHANS